MPLRQLLCLRLHPLRNWSWHRITKHCLPVCMRKVVLMMLRHCLSHRVRSSRLLLRRCFALGSVMIDRQG